MPMSYHFQWVDFRGDGANRPSLPRPRPVLRENRVRTVLRSDIGPVARLVLRRESAVTSEEAGARVYRQGAFIRWVLRR